MNRSKIGVLLVNLGTPDSPSPKDVKSYLKEFLTDGRVIDYPWLIRQALVRGFVIPMRYRESSRFYKKIWTEEGSPLLVYGKKVKQLLQNQLGDSYCVELAMRYKNPSLESTLSRLQDCKQIIIIPLFPQYASATTGSVHEAIMNIVSKWLVIPNLSFIQSYPTLPKMIDAFCEIASEYSPDTYDHFLFSFHGLPERHILKADKTKTCLKDKDCCKIFCEKNKNCYSAQCHATASSIVKKMNLKEGFYSLSFQSRLGREPWLKPYTSEVLSDLVKKGCKKVLVICPAFICDCIETIHEISVEYQEEFLRAGGESLQLVRGLNDHPTWIRALADLVESRTIQKGVE